MEYFFDLLASLFSSFFILLSDIWALAGVIQWERCTPRPLSTPLSLRSEIENNVFGATEPFNFIPNIKCLWNTYMGDQVSLGNRTEMILN